MRLNHAGLANSAVDRTGIAARLARMGRLLAYLVMAFGLAAFVLPRAAPQKRAQRIRAWSRAVLSVLSVEVVYSGLALSRLAGSANVVANHLSWLDALLINAVRPARFVAKVEITSWPIVGTITASAGTLFVNRGKRADVARVNDLIAAALEQGDCVALFPEGTTGDGVSIGRFHSALLRQAARGVLVCPVAIRFRRSDGSICEEVEFPVDQSLLAALWRLTGLRTIYATVISAKPIRFSNERRRATADLLRARIAEMLKSDRRAETLPQADVLVHRTFRARVRPRAELL